MLPIIHVSPVKGNYVQYIQNVSTNALKKYGTLYKTYTALIPYMLMRMLTTILTALRTNTPSWITDIMQITYPHFVDNTYLQNLMKIVWDISVQECILCEFKCLSLQISGYFKQFQFFIAKVLREFKITISKFMECLKHCLYSCKSHLPWILHCIHGPQWSPIYMTQRLNFFEVQ